MTEGYLPASSFLRKVFAENAQLSGDEFGEDNLRKLIALTRDKDRSNRDWAVFLLGQHEADSAEIREAFLQATKDADHHVRAEAILGLAQRSPELALPYIQAALAGPSVEIAIFEAAEIVAHPSLIDDLRAFTEPSNSSYGDSAALSALAACEQAAEHPGSPTGVAP